MIHPAEQPDMPLGPEIRRIRKALGFSQHQLAQAAGVSIGMLRDLEQGRTRSPRWESARAIVRALSAYTLPGADGRQVDALPSAWKVITTDSGSLGSELRLSILGPLSIQYKGREIRIGPLRLRLVLGLLILHREAGVWPSTIADLIWPTTKPASAKSIVHAYVSNIRQFLGSQTEGSLSVVMSGSQYFLRASCDYDVDSEISRTLAREGDAASASGADDRALYYYCQAIALWRGPTLADIDQLRDHFTVVNLDTMRTELILKCSYIDGGIKMVGLLRELCNLEPFNELLHARYMVALVSCGLRADAVRVFEELRSRLDAELGIYPAEVVTAAYRQAVEY